MSILCVPGLEERVSQVWCPGASVPGPVTGGEGGQDRGTFTGFGSATSKRTLLCLCDAGLTPADIRVHVAAACEGVKMPFARIQV